MKAHAREASISFALGLMLLALACFAPSFYQPRPLLSFFTREAPALIVTCGVALVLITRQIDISVGSQFAVCSVCAGLLAGLHWPIGLVLMGSIAIGAMLGAVNGFFVAALRLPSIVVTLATMAIWREALRWKRQGAFVNLPEGLQWFGMNQMSGQIGILLIALSVLAALVVTTRYLAAGRMIYAVGSDAEAARLAGMRPRLVTFLVFVGMGALTGLAALMNTLQSPQVDPKSGTGLELKAIASAVVGGIAIAGGRGNLWGAFVGFLLLACVSPALIHLHIEAYWERAIAGAIILAAVFGEGLPGREKPAPPLNSGDARMNSQ
jgi:ribose/xylose/arabinose/galactoside ABC-type transport system permease subunit